MKRGKTFAQGIRNKENTRLDVLQKQTHRNVRNASYLIAIPAPQTPSDACKFRTWDSFPSISSRNVIQCGCEQGEGVAHVTKIPGEGRRGASVRSLDAMDA